MAKILKRCYLLSIFALWPVVAISQVAPSDVGISLIQASERAVLGTKNEVIWTSIPLGPRLKKSLEPSLKRRRPLPDSLYIGRVNSPDGWRYLIPDEAPSRTETFSFILYLDVSGAIIDVDVLQYRENYGNEIDYPIFRKQFRGRKKPEDILFRRSIQNISGATISARSITYAVHDLLILVDAVGLNHEEKP